MATQFLSKQTEGRSSNQFEANNTNDKKINYDHQLRSSEKDNKETPARLYSVLKSWRPLTFVSVWCDTMGESLVISWLRTLTLCLMLLVASSWGKTLVYSANLATADELSPVVFVPGHGGNQLEIKVDMDEPVMEHCKAKTDWMRAWMDLWQFLPGNINCWAEYNKLEYNIESGEYRNIAGVDSRVPGWGHTDTIEFLDPSLTAWMLGNVGSYGAPLIKEMKTWGYRSGVNLLGAPYDFRYGSPSVPHDYYGKLRELVESAVHQHGKKVVLMAHSMGGLLAHHFLIKQTPEWKSKYIQSLVTLSTPWKGAVVMANAVVSGYTWGHGGLNSLLLRRAQRASESGVFLLPSPSEWTRNDPVITTPKQNYTAFDYDKMFDDMDFPVAKDMWRRIKGTIGQLDHPGVDVFCLYSTGIETPERLVYGEGEFPDSQPHRVMGDGDGTVNLRSAQACTRMWGDVDGAMVYGMKLANFTHNGILRSKEAQDFLKEIVSNNFD